MNGKERTMMVMRGDGIPDRVPFCIGITEGYPVRFTTDDYMEFYHYNPSVPLWKAHIDTERKFGADNFVDYVPPIKDEFKMEEQKVIGEKEDYIIYEKVLHTPDGELFSKVRLGRREGYNTIDPYIKDIAQDLPKMIHMLPDPAKLDFDKYLEVYNYVGENGSLGPFIKFPIEWISDAMGGPGNMIMARYDTPEAFEEFTQIYTKWCEGFLFEFIKRDIPMDVVPMSAASHSYSVTSPDFFDDFGAPFLKRMLELEKKYPDKMVLDQHTCGRSREVVEKAHALGVRAMEPLEGPPMGDVDIVEVKKLFGNDMCLKGNINSIEVMYRGRPEKVREESKRILEACMPGGRFYFAVGDQIPYQTPIENVEALVETALEYGVY